MTEAERTDAEREIGEVLRRYCRAMDRIDAELGYSVWHEDGTAEYGPLFNGSGRGFIDWVCDFHRGLASHSHQIANVSIKLDGDRASSETYVTTGLLYRDGDGHKLRTGRGRYVDRWSKRDGRWAIDHRHYVHDFDVMQDATAELGWGTRDRSDPSYAALAGPEPARA